MSRNRASTLPKEQGFTLVELLVYIILTLLMTTIVFQFMFDFWSSAATLEADSETFVSRQDAGDTLRDNLNVASGLIDQNSIADSHVLVGDPSDGTGTFWLTIHAIPKSTTMPASGSYTPVIYFQAPSVNSSRNFIMNGAQAYHDEFVLYLNGSTKQLMLRRLINSGAAGDRLITTCPAASASSTCPRDAVIADDVSSVNTRYFSRSGNTIVYTSSTDAFGNYNGPDFPAVEVMEITLHFHRASQVNGGADTSNETIIRVATRN